MTRWVRVVAAGLVLVGAGGLAYGFYLPAKAALAQVLLERAWALSGDGATRPWPWAETWPVGRLEVPRLGMDLIVLAGAEGAALAFAPGHVDGSAAPGDTGNVVIAGHRDTVFRSLGLLRLGDEIWLEAPDGCRRRYTVERTEVVHESETSVLEPSTSAVLTLVTCYPLDGTRPGGPLRYVVRARDGSGVVRPPRMAGADVSGEHGVRPTRAEVVGS